MTPSTSVRLASSIVIRKPCPRKLDGALVICYSPIDERHRFTGPRQFVSVMAGVVICQYKGDDGFYILGCDADWQSVTDTWHQTLDDAKNHAELEYEGISKTWMPFK